MKKIILCLLFSLISSSHAVTWQVHRPCDSSIAYQGDKKLNLEKSAGQHSVNLFELAGIEFQGNEMGMNSIMGTPTGMQALEVLSDTEMRSYGWCYQVNGFGPSTLPGNFYFNSQEDHLTWVYGFAHFKDGEWLSYCELAYRSENCESYAAQRDFE
jgi:hypothetical protein